MINNTDLKDILEQPQKIAKLEYKIISSILKKVRIKFSEENLLLEFKGKSDKCTYIVGDIHGNLGTLLKLIDLFKLNNASRVIFLGDIVDRGPYQLECLIIILILKILEPNTYYLLKGNHETLEMNQYYGFFEDFTTRFKNMGRFEEILALYSTLPYAALINKNILCVHGGIPEEINILNKLKGLKTKDIKQIWDSVSEQLMQITWNDPKENLNGFNNSFRGPGIRFFGEDVFKIFMKSNNLETLIRSHEMFPEGYKWFFNNRLLSIFSSENYRGVYSKNPASYAIVDEQGKIHAKILK